VKDVRAERVVNEEVRLHGLANDGYIGLSLAEAKELHRQLEAIFESLKNTVGIGHHLSPPR
jgi:hypothetical protein